MRFIVTSTKDGRGVVKPFISGPSHAGEPFWIGNELLTVTKDNRIYIPKEIMEAHGFLRKDGTRALILETGGRYINKIDNGKLVINPETGKPFRVKLQGADILKSESLDKYLKTGKTGDRIPAEAVSDAVEKGDLKILKATDQTDLYIG